MSATVKPSLRNKGLKRSPLHSVQAFTLIELLVVIAVIAILAEMLLPALHRTKIKAQAMLCMNSNCQLLLAWLHYSGDNADQLPFARGSQYAWVQGVEGLNDSSRPDNWNPDTTIKSGVIWPYCGINVSIWHCPADKSLGKPPSGTPVPRPRSRSMNCWVGGDDKPQNDYKDWPIGPTGGGRCFVS